MLTVISAGSHNALVNFLGGRHGRKDKGTGTAAG